VRLADLATARAAAEAEGLLPQAFIDPSEEVAVRRAALVDIARAQVEVSGRSRGAWNEFARAAAEVASLLEDRADLYRWSASSQAGDAGRKGRGAYSTPPELAAAMAEQALALDAKGDPPLILDPSAGHGALLVAALDRLVQFGVGAAPAARHLFGVELDPHARELCCLILWLSGPGADGLRLDEITRNIVCANTLLAGWRGTTEHDVPRLFDSRDALSSTEPDSMVWEESFPDAFRRGGFSTILMNPPWESLRHRLDSEGADEWLDREPTRDRLSRVEEGSGRRGLPALFSVQGRGDRNLCKGFVELAPHLLRPGGRLVALMPGAFASDLGMAQARELYLEHMAIERWTSFENLAGHFPIDGRYKFGILVADRSPSGTESASFRFLARDADEVQRNDLHVRVSRAELMKLGGAARMFPEVCNRLEVDILLRALDHGGLFFDEGGAFGAVQYRREVDLTLDRDVRFRHVSSCRDAGGIAQSDGSWRVGDENLVPLVEGRMIGPYDFFQKSWRAGEGRSAKWTVNDGLALASCQPQYLSPPLRKAAPRLAICDVTSATNTRTMLAAWIPPSWPCGNTAPVLEVPTIRASLALLAVLNSMTFDWILRRVAAGLHLNRFYLEATPLPDLDDQGLDLLAAYAAAHVRREIRFQSLAPEERAPVEPFGYTAIDVAPSTVEALVARGYGLGPEELRYAFRSDPDDRKGLWRYFAAVPAAVQVADASIRELEAA
jgi:hypothetical protein